MKLKDIKDLLADQIETYSSIEEVDGEDDVTVDLEYGELSPEKRLLNELFNNPVRERLEEYEVSHIFTGKRGFIVTLKVEGKVLEELGKEFKIPVKRYN